MAGTFVGEPWRMPYSAEELETAATNQVPRFNPETSHWERWNIQTGEWEETGAVARAVTVERSYIAEYAYAAGNQLIYQNRVYDVIAPIAAGDHLSVGGNIVPTDGATSSIGELEDLTVRCGRFVNAGEGWQGFAFPTRFDAPPVLTAQPLGFGGWVELRDVTAEGFSYRLRRNVFRAGEWSAGSVSEGEVSANKYFTASAAAASSAHTEQELVDGVTLPEIVLPELTLPTAATADTDEPVTVCWIAMEFNGEEENQ